MLPRQKLRPYVMIERKRQTNITARSALNTANTASFARQVAYTNDGNKIARRAARMVGGGGGGGSGGGGGGSGGSGGGSGGGGGWPF